MFDSMFVLQNMDVEKIELRNLKLTPYGLETKTSKFDLTIISVQTAEGIHFTLEYCTKLFRKGTIQRLTAHYLKILEEITAKPEKRLFEIVLLSEAEKKQILIDFNDTKTGYPKEKTIQELFEEQVERAPDNIAVVFSEKQLTYRELDQQANRLAKYLRTKGVTTERVAGIMAGPSLEMIVGIMGILKAGGAYLPIDPKYWRNESNLCWMIAMPVSC